MKNLLRPLLLVTLVLGVPIIPFLLFGERLERAASAWLERTGSPVVTAACVVAILATDIVLPIPSSLVSTFGGARLGWLVGTVTSWLGMSLGAGFGFALARRWGRRIALRFTNRRDLQPMRRAAERYGVVLLVAARGLPVLAEASVLLFGVQRMSWQRFWPPVLLSNLGIALAYSAFGDLAQRVAWLPAALGISLALPLLLAAAVRRRMLSCQQAEETDLGGSRRGGYPL